MNILSPAAYNPYVSSANAAFVQPLFTQQPVDNLAPPAASYQSQISDYGKISNALADLQAQAQNLSSPEASRAVTQGSKVPATLNAARSNASPPQAQKRIDEQA